MIRRISNEPGPPVKRAKTSPSDTPYVNGSEGDNSPGSSYKSGDDASRAKAPRPRRNASQACNTCRRQKTRCEPPIELGLPCHRCEVLGAKCSFQEERTCPASASDEVNGPPADLDGLRNCMRPEVDTRIHLRSDPRAINNSSPPLLPLPDQHAEAWAVPQIILDALLRQADKSKSQNETAHPVHSHQLTSSQTAELHQIGVARYASWLALPPELLQPGVSAFLDSVLVLLGSRQPGWCHRLSLSTKLYRSIGSDVYATLMAPPSLASICGLLLLALWGPLFEDKVHTGELTLIRAAEVMGRRLKLDEAARGLEEFPNDEKLQELHVRARLWLCMAILDTLLCLITCETPTLASELSPTISALRTYSLHSTALTASDEGRFQEAEFLARAATTVTLLADSSAPVEDLIEECRRFWEFANETRRSLRRVSALVSASGDPFKVGALQFMVYFIVTVTFRRGFTFMQLKIRRSQMLAGHALTPSCSCPQCSHSRFVLNTGIQKLSKPFAGTLEDTLVSFLSLAPAEDPDVPQIYLVGVTYALAWVFKNRITVLEAWEVEPNGGDTTGASSDVTPLVQRVGQRLLRRVAPEVGGGGIPITKEAGPSVRFGKLCLAMTEMWDSVVAAEAERRKRRRTAAPAPARPVDGSYPSAAGAAPAGPERAAPAEPEVSPGSFEDGTSAWVPDGDFMSMFSGSMFDFGPFGEPNFALPPQHASCSFPPNCDRS